MGTVDRVLPWRRAAPPPVVDLAPVVQAFRSRHPKAPTAVITRAYEVANEAHAQQWRESGEKYINHPLAVARIVADFGLDEVAIAAALLHDAVEDSELTVDDVRRAFGDDIAEIVDGVTKLDRLQFDSKEAQQAATMRKMLVAMAKDLRVLIIKLADRLHNMRTIAARPTDKQARIAAETLDIYAPLAHRLGMQELKQQLEDLSFAALHPKRYAEIDHMVASRSPERDLELARVIAEVRHRLAELHIEAEVSGRGKHLWSIYEKMVMKGREFDEIFDLLAVRVIVESIKDCYAALGTIHGTWSPVVGRFKDYIAMPKFNLYQSLHTTVIVPGGKAVEVQIRTREMHHRAERGVAAHWSYKAGTAATGDDIAWLGRMVDWQAETSDPQQFMETLRTDLEEDEVFVFTPKGRVITLPAGSTPVDFAYAVHTEVGHTCLGSRVNGRLVSLEQRLGSGDTCEIFVSKVDGAGPNRDWMAFVVSPRARNKIRQWFSRERRDDAIETGREELVRELRRESLPSAKLLDSEELATVAASFGVADAEALYVAIGENHVSAKAVAQKLARKFEDGTNDGELLPATIQARSRRRKRTNVGVHVEGLDDVMVRLSKCCTPVPGDQIVGFVTRGRGVSVHRADCSNASALGQGQTARMIEVDWDNDAADTMFTAAIEVKALDRGRLLRDVADAFSQHHLNIVGASTHTGGDRISVMRFEIELADPSYLESVVRSIRSIESVYDAYRVVPAAGR